jgi:hypothetical protein
VKDVQLSSPVRFMIARPKSKKEEAPKRAIERQGSKQTLAERLRRAAIRDRDLDLEILSDWSEVEQDE